MFARDGQRSLLGTAIPLNGFIASADVRAWNCVVVPEEVRGIPASSVFTSKKPLLAARGSALSSVAGAQNESLFAALQRDAVEARTQAATTAGAQRAVSGDVASGNAEEEEPRLPHIAAVAAAAAVHQHPPRPQPQASTADAAATAAATAAVVSDGQDPYVTLRSDADQELLLFCPFTEILNVRAMMITCDPSCPPAQEPSSLSLFVNMVECRGFGDARRAAPAQNLRLGSVTGDAIIYSLDGRFRGASSITLFFRTSFGGERTQVARVVFFGDSTREPVRRDYIAVGVVSETLADPRQHVRRLEAETNTRTNRA